jgi:hypothetical protein
MRHVTQCLCCCPTHTLKRSARGNNQWYMDCSVSGLRLKPFSGALACLSKIGKEIYWDAREGEVRKGGLPRQFPRSGAVAGHPPRGTPADCVELTERHEVCVSVRQV